MGSLTLNWKDTSYKDITGEICQTLTMIQEKGTSVNISCTIGHASIPGNDVANKLAKEAAYERGSIHARGKNNSHETRHKRCQQKFPDSKMAVKMGEQ